MNEKEIFKHNFKQVLELFSFYQLTLSGKSSNMQQNDCREAHNLQKASTSPTVEQPSMEKSAAHSKVPASSKRHCAFCLKFVKCQVCTGCKRRAYCSRACQAADWSNGQGHKNWCQKFDYGEEGIDFEVRSIPGKGLGLVAKRKIPSLYRIMVEAVYTSPHGHPGINDLTPMDASLDLKFVRNAFTGDPSYKGGKDYVALRMARANHACDANAGHNFCEVSHVEILNAFRDIQEGEEICISYLNFANINMERPLASLKPEKEFSIIKSVLKGQWGFALPIAFAIIRSSKSLL